MKTTTILFSAGMLMFCTGCKQQPELPNSSRRDFPAYTSFPEDHSEDVQSSDSEPAYVPSTQKQQQGTEEILEEADRAIQAAAAQKAPALSKAYHEGYDRGYDDGEDDAVGHNGYEGQYDDRCRYKGQQRKDYRKGYADGYEAGFYDNVADDGSDEDYE